jgi:hypothetical protein
MDLSGFRALILWVMCPCSMMLLSYFEEGSSMGCVRAWIWRRSERA